MIQIKRVYDEASPEDGTRYLVDRLWPRGMRKDQLEMSGWLKDIAPSRELVHSFHRGVLSWTEFHAKYSKELEMKRELWTPVVEAAEHGVVTLLYAARDVQQNNAIALREFLLSRATGGHSSKRRR